MAVVALFGRYGLYGAVHGAEVAKPLVTLQKQVALHNDL